jgi:hypothetical protein
MGQEKEEEKKPFSGCTDSGDDILQVLAGAGDELEDLECVVQELLPGNLYRLRSLRRQVEDGCIPLEAWLGKLVGSEEISERRCLLGEVSN